MKLGVIGSPIGHSRSPAMHRAAYGVLGLPWTYEAHEVDAQGFDDFTASIDGHWRGLSVTAPLKELAAGWARDCDHGAAVTGAVNTLLVQSRRGFNTDIDGIVAAFGAVGVHEAPRATVIGAGATAMSALAAFASMGAKEVDVRLRNPQRLQPLADLADRLGIRLHAAMLDVPVTDAGAVVSTLPAAAAAVPRLEDATAILDADYARGFSRYELDHSRVISGLEMLLEQAVVQVRIFAGGDPARVLPNEPAVRRAMRAAAGLE